MLQLAPAFPWFHFIARGLALLQQRRLEDGRALLARSAERAAGLTEAPGSVRTVLERWWAAAQAYSHYCIEEHDTAESLMGRTEDAVRTAVAAGFPRLPGEGLPPAGIRHPLPLRRPEPWSMWQ
jgi:hypothetical protein